jgi:hypothetical protein
VTEINSQGYPSRSPSSVIETLSRRGENPQKAEVPKMSEIFPLISSTIQTAQFPESAINIFSNVSPFTSHEVARFTDVAGILSLLLRKSYTSLSKLIIILFVYTKGMRWLFRHKQHIFCRVCALFPQKSGPLMPVAKMLSGKCL